MNAVARARYLRISPLKLRKVIKILKGKELQEAMDMMKLLPHKGAKMVYKVLHAAKANFISRYPDARGSVLVIDRIFVDEAGAFKRVMPRARGRADIIHRRMSHLTVVVKVME
ncbi:50S ribosomal protein L22 [Thermospira aquatica]|uniref:Large ribosomal subunit protein uL22 n=1 Tax=Thermospira aquatica TaxID=2828656 RepID=A0AAX3BGP0_9SPIR|nr:50S ribosomal protein L22 [Thermospira aquatica]URA11328.1 50S ribosomal protein L22 [Thermospira aquatica]